MARKRKRRPIRTPEERARSQEIGRRLAERIAYHKAKLAEERATPGDAA